MKFTINQFREKYPDDDTCLHTIFELRYGDLKVCPNEDCEKETKFHRVKNRRCYECQWCGHQIYPTRGTIFEKSTTSLTNWFYAMYLMTATRSGVSAKEIERQLGVTYKCAWRMAHQIRKLMSPKPNGKLSGVVEVDETYVGGKQRGIRGRGAKGKTVVMGLAERGGELRATKIENVKKATVQPVIRELIESGSVVFSDELSSYDNLADYKHEVVKHSAREYVRGLCHTQTIEGFWSQLKRGIRGTHIWVSKKHLQRYIDEFAYRYNARHEPSAMFNHLLARLSRPS